MKFKVRELLDLQWSLDEIKKLRLKLPIGVSLKLLKYERFCLDVKNEFFDSRDKIIEELFEDVTIKDENGNEKVERACKDIDLFTDKTNEILNSEVETDFDFIDESTFLSIIEKENVDLSIDINVIYALSVIFKK